MFSLKNHASFINHDFKIEGVKIKEIPENGFFQ
jgi:hypothetical protein